MLRHFACMALCGSVATASLIRHETARLTLSLPAPEPRPFNSQAASALVANIEAAGAFSAVTPTDPEWPAATRSHEWIPTDTRAMRCTAWHAEDLQTDALSPRLTVTGSIIYRLPEGITLSPHRLGEE